MRTGQLQALANTRHAQGHPFDAIDMAFGLLAAISASPIAGIVAFTQYFARRSPWVAETLLNAVDLPPALEDTRLVRGVLPGASKLLPAPHEDDRASDLLATAETPQESPHAARVFSTAEWRDALHESPHVLIHGPSKAGKSTLAQAIVSMFQGCEYVVIDPQPNKPGERKWGGIDFITLDDHGSDEYASIKTALARIKAEDARRRRNAKHHTPRQLVVIIDEVLALVGALGITTNEEGKREPRLTEFIRTMGYSARHRNIKIILIGQGKNLADLGLSSGTGRNNYALVRAARNAATNVRSAFIATDEGEQLIDVHQVQRLASAATQQAQVWLTHADLAPVSTASQPNNGDLLSTLLGETLAEPRVKPAAPSDNGVSGVSMGVSAAESAVSKGFSVSVSAQEAAKIAVLLERNAPSKVAKMLDGFNGRNYAELKAKVDAVAAMLNQQPRQNDPDAPDPDEDGVPAFRGVL